LEEEIDIGKKVVKFISIVSGKIEEIEKDEGKREKS
jgi:hypothetical protein